jgi:hypothetical protein
MDKKPQMICVCGHEDNRHETIDNGTRDRFGHDIGDWGAGNCELCGCKRFEAYVEPSPKDKVCTIPQIRDCYYPICPEDSTKCKHWQAPQPEPMPLIENIYQATLITGFAFTEGCKQQRDADMAWHLEKVQQVRKDFAEEYIKTMRKVGHKNGAIPNTVPYAEGAEKQFEVCIAHLRAMAGGVSDGT